MKKKNEVHIFVWRATPDIRPPYNVHVVFSSVIPQGNEKSQQSILK